MDLSAFVAGTLVEIAAGVKQANERFAKTTTPGAHGYDTVKPFELESSLSFGKSTALVDAHYVEFDVAVTAGKESKDNAGASVGISVLQLGVGGASRSSSETVSRISFKVRIAQRVT